ncbi:MAG: hypothetical protein KF814_08125 [Nitrospiraceae bacterium]|nr:hypothetical protein [Nitrospiraceae bacterium]
MVLIPEQRRKTMQTCHPAVQAVPGQRLVRLQAWREGAGMRPNVPHVAQDRDDMRATGGESRRRAQRTRPRLGNTGASIAQTDHVL